MTAWSLSQLLSGLHEDIQQRLQISRKSFGHPGTKGDASETVWLKLLPAAALPGGDCPCGRQRGRVQRPDRRGGVRSPVLPVHILFEGQTIIPAESVYAVFEAKQTVNADLVRYARRKVASVRRLHRTSLPIPHAGGTYPQKPLIPILGGLLTFESEWSPALGPPFEAVLKETDGDDRLDLGCFAAHGDFSFDAANGQYRFACGGKPATSFLFNLISRLQFSGTVPMIDVQAYGRWLTL